MPGTSGLYVNSHRVESILDDSQPGHQAGDAQANQRQPAQADAPLRRISDAWPKNS